MQLAGALRTEPVFLRELLEFVEEVPKHADLSCSPRHACSDQRVSLVSINVQEYFVTMNAEEALAWTYSL